VTTTARKHRAGSWLLALLALGLVVGGFALLRSQDGAAGAQPSDGTGETPSASTPAEATTTPTPPPPATRAPWRPGAPRRLVIPALGVDAPVVPVKAPGRTLLPPQDAQQLGWWADGAQPGAREGSALVAGHTVHTGGGALDDLEAVPVGGRIQVRVEGRRLTYRVQDVQVLGKGQLARRAETLFSQDVPGRLVVLTCEDWNGSEYLSNVVVTATPVR
jgi:LPXTG-site transpeptidase (sortase) family protein